MTDAVSTINPMPEEPMNRLSVEAISEYAIYMLDRSGVITSWNPDAQRFNGYQYPEIIGKHFSIFYAEEDRKKGLPRQALEIAACEGTFKSEGWRVRRDGSRFWAHVTVDPIRDQVGNILGFANISRNLSERMDGKESLTGSDDPFRVLIQGVADYGVYLLDAEGRVSSWNSGAQKIKGYDEHEILGRNFSIFYTEEARQKGEPQRALETAARDGKFEIECWRLRKDGSVFRANVLIGPIRTSNGSIAGFAEVTRDLTESVKAQVALKNAREALFQSQKMEAIGQLTGGVAHDFNNILMAVLGGLEIVQRRLPTDPQITPLLENAIQAAQRGRSLTKRMLAFARRHELKPEPIDLSALVAGMTDLLQQSVGPSTSIKADLPPGLEAVFVDPNQLELAILNLVMNARDAAPGGGCISLSACSGSPCSFGTEYICLSIAGNGEAMNEAALARAREAFCTTRKPPRDVGVGLSMVDGLAEQSGGRLVIKSRQGGGTVAELWLPVSETARLPNVHSARLDPVG